MTLKEYMSDIEKSYINKVVKECNEDKEKAAKKLNISVATLYRKM